MNNILRSLGVHFQTRSLTVLAALMLGLSPALAEQRPNVIFILVDDLGWMDSSLYGSTFYKTPAMERLAKSSVRFTNAYSASPLCSPSRASILSGQYPARHGMTEALGHTPVEPADSGYSTTKLPEFASQLLPRSKRVLELDQHTLAEAFRDAGYRTGFIGKWHMGLAPEFWPERQGFDFTFHGAPDPGPPSYFSPYKFKAGTITDGPAGEYITDRATDEAIRFINQDKGKPFFLCLWHWGVHTPLMGKPELIEYYRQHPDPKGKQLSPTMAAMIQSVDESLGRLLDDLESTGLDKNTIIVFTSDNGGLTNKKVEADGNVPVTNNFPLRRGKASIFEGGGRVPALIRWPGVTDAGAVSEQPITGVDYYPTLLEIASIPQPADQVLDGLSLVPALKGQELGREAIYCYFPHSFTEYSPPGAWVREGDWKLLENFWVSDFWPDQFLLYNLKQDIGETTNLAEKHPEIVSRLAAKLKEHYSMGGRPPKPNPDYNPAFTPVGGWIPSSKEGPLTLDASGMTVLGPGLSTRGLVRESGTFTLRWTMRTERPGKGKVFWCDYADRTFKPDRRVEFDVISDGRPHTYEVSFTSADSLFGVRLDFGNGTLPVVVEKIELLAPAKQALQQWLFAKEAPRLP
jgi:arylsulfatase A-like enzyme